MPSGAWLCQQAGEIWRDAAVEAAAQIVTDHRDGNRGRDSGLTVRRKGVVSGSLDTGLNAMPFVGALKNVVEVMRGRDFFPDRIPAGAGPRRVSGH